MGFPRSPGRDREGPDRPQVCWGQPVCCRRGEGEVGFRKNGRGTVDYPLKSLEAFEDQEFTLRRGEKMYALGCE